MVASLTFFHVLVVHSDVVVILFNLSFVKSHHRHNDDLCVTTQRVVRMKKKENKI